jgi:small subunit ribosomal protein S4
LNNKRAFKVVKTSAKFNTIQGFDLWGRPLKSKNAIKKAEGRSNRVKRKSTYGVELNATQYYKNFYGNISESYLQTLVKKARNSRQPLEQYILSTLEHRFDVLLYRIGFVSTPLEGRQLIKHGHFKINGQKSDIPSIILNKGDLIETCPEAKSILMEKMFSNITKNRSLSCPPEHVEVCYKTLKAIVLSGCNTRNAIHYVSPEFKEFYDFKWVLQRYNR